MLMLIIRMLLTQLNMYCGSIISDELYTCISMYIYIYICSSFVCPSVLVYLVQRFILL